MQARHAIALVGILTVACGRKDKGAAADAGEATSDPPPIATAPEPTAPASAPMPTVLAPVPTSSGDPRERACAALEICMTPAAAKKLAAPDAGTGEGACPVGLDAKRAKSASKKRLVVGADGRVPLSDACSARARENRRAESCCYNVPSGLDTTLRDLDDGSR